MRPLRKGAARTALASGLAKLAQVKIESFAAAVPAERQLASVGIAQLQAAVLGGAIEEAIREMFPLAEQKKITADFWRYTNENLWRLTRALEASNLLDKAGD